jgi:hypothetical protein
MPRILARAADCLKRPEKSSLSPFLTLRSGQVPWRYQERRPRDIWGMAVGLEFSCAL